MKKITLLFLLLTVTFSYTQNLLQNGDFENTDPNAGGQANGLLPQTGAIWTTSMTANARPGINNNASVAHAGSNFMNVQNDFQSFRQSFTAVIGKEYTVNFWNQFISGQGQITDPDDGLYVGIRQDTGDNGTNFDPIITFYIDPTTINGDWHQFTFTFTAPATNLLLYVSKQARNADGDGGLNNACRMDDFSIIENSTASVTDLSEYNFKAYPNPANNQLFISASEQINAIQIFSILGKMVLNKKTNATKINLNIADLSPGIYMVKTQIDTKVGTYKLIKN